MSNNDSKDRGCGCVFWVLTILAIVLLTDKCKKSENIVNTEACVDTTEVKTSNVFSNECGNEYNYSKQEISPEDNEEIETYLNNSLETGATPYRKFYGRNYKCSRSVCSAIKVTAPHESDIVVIIKRNNADGKVISHGYINAGETLRFDIPDGTYQTFFYYGQGWNPNKQMEGDVKGGFVKHELFSKDEPKAIYNGVLTYVLQLTHDGNFQTESSNQSEMF